MFENGLKFFNEKKYFRAHVMFMGAIKQCPNDDDKMLSKIYKNLGEIEITFVDKEGTEMLYSTKLPEVNILEKMLDIQMNIDYQIEEKKMYTFQLLGRTTKEPFSVDILIDSNEDFLLDGETSKKVLLPQDMSVLLQVNFMAIRTGELKFPTISVFYVSERGTSTIWQNSPTVYSEYSHILPM